MTNLQGPGLAAKAGVLTDGQTADTTETITQAQPVLDSAVEWARALLEPISATPWVQAVIVVAASMVLAKLLDLTCTGALRLVSRRTTTLVDDKLIALLHRPVMATVVLYGALVATVFLDADANVQRLTGRVVMTLVILTWVLFSLRASRVVLHAASREGARFKLIEARTFPLFSNLAAVIVVAIGTWLLIGLWGASMTGWLASAGVVGIAVGFAAQDTLSNLFSGVFLIADGPFGVGDYIVLDTGDRGRVEHIGLRSTRLLTRDDVLITIPNAVIGGGRITNQSSGGSQRMRVKIPVQVAYGSDIDQLREILLEIAAAEPLVLEFPEPNVRFRAMADSGLNFELMVWASDPSRRGRTVDALNSTIYKRLNVEGIEIPYPKRDIYLHQA
ncbi:MAG: mechanosensitive ion channel family protein [Planctomycetota bacterium]|nr:mechanosensitive ion channel family protein [Planctomycetota bacterium]